MKIQFDSAQQYQLDAIQAVVDVFDGQPLAQGQFEINMQAPGELLSDLGRGNACDLDRKTLLANAARIQARNQITATPALLKRGLGAEDKNSPFLNFSLEMETGTGKTYAYLRSIYELHARYGFAKFVIVVPSVAIREGVKTSLDLMRDHFATLYGNCPGYTVYDSKRLSALRQFAQSNTLQILILNIQAFDKAINVMNRDDNDALHGRKPIEYIQATRPIVILDEPQNMESLNIKTAISALHPLCTLRYSATHKTLYQLLYRLDPVRAYDLGLVKRIEVDSVLEEGDFNQPFVRVESITATKTKITAKLTIHVRMATGIVSKTVAVSGEGARLLDLSNGHEVYADYIVEEINNGKQYICFTNGIQLDAGQSQGEHKEEVMQVQVRQTVLKHLEKERELYRALPEGRRVKVLSLFFIDRVANYYPDNGKIRRWFVDAYAELAGKPRYQCLSLPPVSDVHNGYFAKTKEGAKDTSEGRNTQADDDAYRLIMQDKERLMDRATPLRFLFSHSALREGWDNPNVFQICTLNESVSETRKRQEIGRGLRLPVDESGQRVRDPDIARLTVIANESYQAFARGLQNEIEEDTGEKFGGRVANACDRRQASLIPDWQTHSEFRELWERIKTRTRYSVEYDTAKLITQAADALRQQPSIHAPVIRTRTDEIILSKDGVQTQLSASREHRPNYYLRSLPDMLSYLQRETRLTRSTLAQILTQSGRLADAVTNAQQFLDAAVRAIKYVKHNLMVDGIKYERIENEQGAWDMMLFAEKEINGYADRMIQTAKSLYDAIECDSQTETKFAAGLESRGDIKFFLKLPRWFKIETPLGTYNPDWAIVRQDAPDEMKLYLVRETKSTTNTFDIRPAEEGKITCGRAHFAALVGIDFAKATDPADV